VYYIFLNFNPKTLSGGMNMKKYFNVIFAFLLVLAFMPACGNGGGEGDADAEATDDGTPPEPGEDVVDPTGDDPVAEQEVIPDAPEEEAPACPVDTPPSHIYIDVDGTVASLDGETAVAGMLVAAISPMDALLNPTPVHLQEDTVGADGSFAFDCLDVGPVDLGLVVLADDSGSAATWYPTGTGIKAWGTPPVKEDVTGAMVFGISETLAAGIEALTSMDFDTTGVVMGLVVDGTTGTPIDGAVVARSGSGTPLNVAYPNAAMDNLETDGNTSANGSFVIVITAALPLTNITATASGYTFDVHQAATKAGFIYFLAMPGTPG
jgi:hypothetical protein